MRGAARSAPARSPAAWRASRPAAPRPGRRARRRLRLAPPRARRRRGRDAAPPRARRPPAPGRCGRADRRPGRCRYQALASVGSRSTTWRYAVIAAAQLPIGVVPGRPCVHASSTGPIVAGSGRSAASRRRPRTQCRSNLAEAAPAPRVPRPLADRRRRVGDRARLQRRSSPAGSAHLAPAEPQRPGHRLGVARRRRRALGVALEQAAHRLSAQARRAGRAHQVEHRGGHVDVLDRCVHLLRRGSSRHLHEQRHVQRARVERERAPRPVARRAARQRSR